MTFEERKNTYLEYLKMKVVEEDWHGVADAAMDLREIEAERAGELKGILDNPPFRGGQGQTKNNFVDKGRF